MKSCSKIIQLSVLLSSFVTLWYILPGELQVCECSSHRDRFILTRWFVFVYTAKNFSLWQCLETRSQSLFQSILQSRKYFRYLKQYKSLLFTHKLEFSLFLSFFLKCFKCKKKECLVPMALKWYLPVPELRKKRDEGGRERALPSERDERKQPPWTPKQLRGATPKPFFSESSLKTTSCNTGETRQPNTSNKVLTTAHDTSA